MGLMLSCIKYKPACDIKARDLCKVDYIHGYIASSFMVGLTATLVHCVQAVR